MGRIQGPSVASDLHIKRALKRLRLKPVPSPADTNVGSYDPEWAHPALAWIERRPACGRALVGRRVTLSDAE